MDLGILEGFIETGNVQEIENLITVNPNLLSKQTSQGVSPLLLACYYNKPSIIRLFLNHLHHISIHEASAVGLALEVYKILTENDQELNKYSENGFTPLGIAAHFGQNDVVRTLLANHADPNLFSQNGYKVYPLHVAVHKNFDQVVKMLLEAEAEVNVFQNQRNTPLHYAAYNGNIEIIILLLEHGAHVSIKNENGQTPSDMAFERGFQEIGKILKL